MNGFKWASLALVGIGLWIGFPSEALAQRVRLYYGGTSSYGVAGTDSHGHLVDGYGRHAGRTPVSGPYYGGGYYPGVYSSPYGYSSGYGSSYGLIGGGYPAGAYGTGFGYSGYGYHGFVATAPIVVAPPVLGTTTTIIRGSPAGGVVQYNNNGNGYTYTPDSAYTSVVTQSPVVGPTRTYVVDGPPPVVIESRPSSALPGNRLTPSRSTGPTAQPAGNIKLSCPKTAPGPLSYSLNGNVYTIQPGYSQTFPEDRPWTIEFKRGGVESEVASLPLHAGKYTFVAGPNGWDLQSADVPANLDLPPAPLPPAPEPMP